MSAPFFENFFKMERPMPRFAPVISANLFFSISLLPKLYFIKINKFYYKFILYITKNFFIVFFKIK